MQKKLTETEYIETNCPHCKGIIRLDICRSNLGNVTQDKEDVEKQEKICLTHSQTNHSWESSWSNTLHIFICKTCNLSPKDCKGR